MMMRILEGGNEEMFHLVIDLEMCKVPRDYRSKSYRYAYETIQIGAVLLDDSFKRIGTLCQYVHPEHGVIDYFIENLTGIKNSQVKNAPKLEEALGRVEIEPEGNFHDGLDDAVNTGYLIEKLELNPEYQLVSYEMPDKPSERLSSTLGELFAGLDLRFT